MLFSAKNSSLNFLSSSLLKYSYIAVLFICFFFFFFRTGDPFKRLNIWKELFFQKKEHDIFTNFKNIKGIKFLKIAGEFWIFYYFLSKILCLL